MRGVKLILLGDLQQFPAIAGSWAGSPIRDDQLENSQFLWELASGRRLQLTTNHRSDQRLFDFYSQIDVRKGSVCDWLEVACKQFPLTSRLADTHLVISHKDRLRINAAMNSAESKQKLN